MKIALFGSTGMAGKVVLRKALERGHEVTVLMRSKPAAPLPEHVRVVIGDARDPVAVGQTLQGVESVIQTLGVGGLGDGRPNNIVADATKIILEQMQHQQIRRIVCASNVGLPGSGAFVLRKILIPIAARKLIPILEAKVRMEAILKASTAEWTSVRLPALSEKADRNTLRISAEGMTQGFSITTGDAASFLLDIVQKRQHLCRAVAISN